jgi:hypothetical protein
MSFSPCLACRRHVRAGDETCPFCGVAAPPPRASASPTTRLTRGALFAFATTVAACGGTETTDGSTDTGTVTDGSTSDSAADTSAVKDDGIDTADTGLVAAYGGPPDTGAKVDSGADSAADGTATDGGGGAPLYGAPP